MIAKMRARQGMANQHARTSPRGALLKTQGDESDSFVPMEKPLKGPQSVKEIEGILIYLVFISVYIASTSNHFDQNIFFFSNSLKSQFTGVEMQEQFSPTFDKSFEDVATVEEYYHWLQSGFFHSSFSPNTFDSSDRLAGMQPGYTVGPNKIIGAIRISQTRSDRVVCSETPAELAGEGGPLHCWGGREPVNPFGNFTMSGTSSQFQRSGIKVYPEYELLPADSVTKERETPCTSYRGKQLEIVYEAPAWAVVLDPTAPLSVNKEAILAMVDGKYIDLQTTAVFVDLTVYNPNLDYMCVIKLVAELPPGGGVYTSSEFHVIRVYDQYTDEDQRLYILEVVVGIFYGYFFLQECLGFRKLGWRYLRNPTNYMVICNVFLYGYKRYYEHLKHSLAPSNIDVDGSDFLNYWPAAECARFVIQLASANCFINFFQALEHLSYVPTFALLSDTIKCAGPDLLGFGFVFMLIFYGFAQAHTMVFRDRVQGFRSLKHSAYSLMSALLGDFNFDELYEADSILGPFFFVFFISLAVFVVLNMVIAIISDAYTVCSEKMKLKPKVNLTVEIYGYFLHKIEHLPYGVGIKFKQKRMLVEEAVAANATHAASKFAEVNDAASKFSKKHADNLGVAADGMASGVFNKLDIDGDGSVSYAELTRSTRNVFAKAGVTNGVAGRTEPNNKPGSKGKLGRGKGRQIVPVEGPEKGAVSSEKTEDSDAGSQALVLRNGSSPLDSKGDGISQDLLALDLLALDSQVEGISQDLLETGSDGVREDDARVIDAMGRTIELQQEQLRDAQQMLDFQAQYTTLLKRKHKEGSTHAMGLGDALESKSPAPSVSPKSRRRASPPVQLSPLAQTKTLTVAEFADVQAQCPNGSDIEEGNFALALAEVIRLRALCAGART
jgi:hypothetical protein